MNDSVDILEEWVINEVENGFRAVVNWPFENLEEFRNRAYERFMRKGCVEISRHSDFFHKLHNPGFTDEYLFPAGFYLRMDYISESNCKSASEVDYQSYPGNCKISVCLPRNLFEHKEDLVDFLDSEMF